MRSAGASCAQFRQASNFLSVLVERQLCAGVIVRYRCWRSAFIWFLNVAGTTSLAKYERIRLLQIARIPRRGHGPDLS